MLDLIGIINCFTILSKDIDFTDTILDNCMELLLFLTYWPFTIILTFL